MLVTSLAAPRAFGRDATTFAIAYLIVRALHLVLYAIAGRGDRELLRAVLRILPAVLLSVLLLVAASRWTERRSSSAGRPPPRSTTSDR